jgi:LAO/AO transport system kinase
VLAIATARMRRRLEEDLGEDAEFQALIEQVVERRIDPASAAATLLEREAARVAAAGDARVAAAAARTSAPETD